MHITLWHTHTCTARLLTLVAQIRVRHLGALQLIGETGGRQQAVLRLGQLLLHGGQFGALLLAGGRGGVQLALHLLGALDDVALLVCRKQSKMIELVRVSQRLCGGILF